MIEQNGKKRFWDVTWEGGHVEVSAGAWGNFGDVGAGHLLLTPQKDVRFSWASH